MKPLVDKKFKLLKHDGKGGWTYAVIPDLPKDSKSSFGYIKVKGSIDGYPIKQLNLMPMSDGNFFMPLKAELRKKIQKEAGNTVHIILYIDTDELEIPAELQMCLEDEPKALKFFNTLSNSEKKYYVQWVYGAKRMETKINRMATTISKLSMGLKMYDKMED